LSAAVVEVEVEADIEATAMIDGGITRGREAGEVVVDIEEMAETHMAGIDTEEVVEEEEEEVTGEGEEIIDVERGAEIDKMAVGTDVGELSWRFTITRQLPMYM
jgi:hypothetical protein